MSTARTRTSEPRTAVPRRLRFEVLRRDGHRCRYCGAGPENAKLTVDHVIPQALGGLSVPENLVTACDPCNSGKASVPADAPTVAGADERALLWREAIIAAGDDLRGERILLQMDVDQVTEAWRGWRRECDGQEVPHAVDWEQSIRRWLAYGVPAMDLVELIPRAMEKQLDSFTDARWRYFCGCVWRHLDQVNDRALEIAGGGSTQ
jgi:hypothetical protein